MSTIIRKRCHSCGHTDILRIYGYVQDPIGIPVSVCPKCGNFFRERGMREWVQMGPVRKYFAISPRADAFAFFGSLVLDVATMGLYLLLTENFPALRNLPGSASFPIRMLIANFLLLHYLITLGAANSEKFRTRLVASIRRTRNESYRQVLESIAPLNHEGLPPILFLTNKSKDKIAAMLAQQSVEEKIQYPTMFESIRNI